jgi:hypothetical protein
MAVWDEGDVEVEEFFVAMCYDGANDVTFGDAQWSASVTAAATASKETGTTTSIDMRD